MAKSYPYSDPSCADARMKVLELVADAVTAGAVHLYDVEPLAKTYMEILAFGPECFDRQDEAPPTEATVTRKAKH